MRLRWVLAALIVGVSVAASACSGGDDEAATDEAATSPADGDADATAGDDAESGSTTDEGSTSAPSERPPPVDRQDVVAIHVDQFGYRPGDPKVGVAADPEIGRNADLDVDLGGVVQVRRVDDDAIVLEVEPEPWNGGQVSEQSGDRGWWVDFGALDEPGEYYLVDPATGHHSHPFAIDEAVYDDVLDAALRMFWYNRGNIEHPADLAGPWSDAAAIVGDGQDGEARSVDAQDDPTTARDLTGGWFDAGDTNKYVTFATEPVHGLLTIYRRHPDLFDDALGIPESGNGIPDVVDEVKWETDWLERMQLDDGSVLIKVGQLGFAHEAVPSAEFRPRYYEEACSSSTIAAAGMLANAAGVYAGFPALAEDAARLQERAEAAWSWYQANPKRDDCDPQEVKAGDADWSVEVQAQYEVVAAIYLFALTGDEVYHDTIRQGVADTEPFLGEGFGHYRPDQADALLLYRTLPAADPAVRQVIDDRIADLTSWSSLLGFTPENDLYRSFMPDYTYHWGSSRVRANAGAANLLLDAVPDGAERAAGHLHYFHGVNPLGLVYLTNMGSIGAERSAQHLFHYWFGEGSEFDVSVNPDIGVPPGYVVGGPNRAYGGNSQLVRDQPPQKAYVDRPASEVAQAWELTEPAIYYQSGYLRLLAAVADS